MYFPYLWCRQEESLAIAELVAAGVLGQLIVPILKPVDDRGAVIKRLAKIATGGGRFALITNSDAGAPPPTSSAIIGHINGRLAAQAHNVFPAFELRAGTAAADLRTFAAMFAGREIFVVHRDHTLGAPAISAALAGAGPNAFHVYLDGGTPTGLRAAISGRGTILLRDSFSHHAPNGTYPSATHFDDLVYQYTAMGLSGFADFATVGDRFLPGGGPARHVAIHLTENVSGPTVHCNHFVSATPAITGNNAAKYFSALGLLCAHTGSPPTGQFATAGVRGFHASQSNAHFPGLGQPKRWSIMHHLERAQTLLQAARATPFV